MKIIKNERQMENNSELFPIIKRSKNTESEFTNALKSYKYKINGEFYTSEKFVKQRQKELIDENDKLNFLEEEMDLHLTKSFIETEIDSENCDFINKDEFKNNIENKNKDTNSIYFEGYFKNSYKNPKVFISSDLIIDGKVHIVICNDMKDRGYYQCYIRPMKKEGSRGFVVIKDKFTRNIFKEKIEKRKFFSNPKNREMISKKTKTNE